MAFDMAVGYIDNNAFVQQIIDKGIAEANQRNTGEMGKQDFLNLLVLQLRYQDPLNPVDDKEFIAQMAQFSALEQMQAMNASNTAMKGFSMIGKYVSAMVADSVTGQAQWVEGHVESVVMSGSKTFVVVGGREVPIDSVYNVSDGFNPLNSTLSAYTGLIGYNVKGAVFDLTTGEIVGVSGDVVSLIKGAYEDYAMLNGANVQIAGINKNGTIIEDRNEIREYLEGIEAIENPADRHIEIFITDGNGMRVPMGATLRSYEIDPVFGTVKAVLDDVAVPVASVAAIHKTAAAAAAAEAVPGVAEAAGAADDTEATEVADGASEAEGAAVAEDGMTDGMADGAADSVMDGAPVEEAPAEGAPADGPGSDGVPANSPDDSPGDVEAPNGDEFGGYSDDGA